MYVKNWISFYGEHDFDLSIDKSNNKNVILIHGETSNGKTSLTSAIQWVISGNIKVERKIGNNIAKLSRKLMMFDMPKWKGSLLNWESYREGNYDLAVSIKFSHLQKNYSATRVLFPTNHSKFSTMEDEISSRFLLVL